MCQPGATVTSATASLPVASRRARTGSSAARAGSAARISNTAGSSRRADSDAVTGDSAERNHLRLHGIAGAHAGGVRQRHPFDDLETVPGQADQPQRVVGEPADLAHPDVAQDLRADTEVPEDTR